MTKQTVVDQERIVDEMDDEMDRVAGAIGAADYMLGNRSTWSEFLFEEGVDVNYDGLCRIIGAVKVPRSVKVGSLADMKSYLLNQHRILADQQDLERAKLLRLLYQDRDRMIAHIKHQYEDTHNRFKGADPQSLEWHRLQACMETYKHLLFVANKDLPDQS